MLFFNQAKIQPYRPYNLRMQTILRRQLGYTPIDDYSAGGLDDFGGSDPSIYGVMPGGDYTPFDFPHTTTYYPPEYPGDLGDWGGIILDDIYAGVGQTIQQGMSSLDAAIRNALGSGSGGAADPVPVQDQVLSMVLAPVSSAVQIPAVMESAPTLQALYSFLTGAERRWLDFLRANWSDRAAGAQQTLAPYFSGLETKLQTGLARLGSSPTGYIPGTNIPFPTGAAVAGGGIGLLLGLGAMALLMRKRGRV